MTFKNEHGRRHMFLWFYGFGKFVISFISQ